MNEITNRKILIIEDNRKLLTELSEYFRARGNEVFCAENLRSALECYASENIWDAVVLDLILPDGTGLDFFNALKNPAPPVIILSDLSGDEDILTGFDAGAADYIAKPCSPEVLEARLKMRLLPRADAQVTLCGLSVDANTRTAKYKGQLVALTSSEFNILFFLMKNAGSYFASDEIYERVWHAASLQTKTVRKHISTLRQKLKELAPERALILTDFGKGYCFTGGGRGDENK